MIILYFVYEYKKDFFYDLIPWPVDIRLYVFRHCVHNKWNKINRIKKVSYLMTIGFDYGYHSPCLHDILQTWFHAPGVPPGSQPKQVDNRLMVDRWRDREIDDR